MTPEAPKHKLAAIMFTDMVGYTTLMQQDETKARELIEFQREILARLVKKHDGEVLQYVGDGTLCKFESSIEAVNAAIEIQQIFKIENEVSLRIGIHVGDVVVKGDEIYGDGVNVASRIEPLAEPGGICVTEEVYRNIKNQEGISARSLGSKKLKNVEESLKIYSIEAASTVDFVKSVDSQTADSEISETKIGSKSDSKKLIYMAAGAVAIIFLFVWLIPFFDSGERSLEASGEIRSIAVLPLDNLSNDPNQDYFSDGMTEALIADISKIRALKVISRTSIMRYKGTDKSLPEIARELKVDAILEGSVMHAEGEVRITAQLIRAATDEHLWANSYTDKLENILSLQSKIARAIADEIKVTLSPEEKKNIGGERKVNPDAYNLYLQAQKIDKWVDLDRTGEAIELLEKALVIDENFIEGWIDLSDRISIDHFVGGNKLKPNSRAAEALERAKKLDPTKIETLLAEGHFYYYGNKDFANGLESYYRVLKNDPNNSTALEHVGYVQRRMGKWEASLDKFLEVYKKDPYNADLVRSIGDSYRFMRDFEKSELFYKRVLEFEPKFTQLYVELARLAYQKTGNPKKALAAMEGVASVTRPEYYAVNKSMYFALDGNLEAALNEIKSVSDSDLQESSDLSLQNYFIGRVYYFIGDNEKSKEHFSLFLPDIQRAVEDELKQEFWLELLSFTYAHLGHKDRAISTAMNLIELLPISEDAMWGSLNESSLAQIYTIVGEYDKALSKIEFLLSIPSSISVESLKVYPVWEPLHDLPRYQEIIKKYSPEA